MKPLMLQGAAAFSPFRIDALAEKVWHAVKGSEEIRIEAQFVYLLDVQGELDTQTLARACSLLGAAGSAAAAGGFFVTPRKGTI